MKQDKIARFFSSERYAGLATLAVGSYLLTLFMTPRLFGKIA